MTPEGNGLPVARVALSPRDPAAQASVGSKTRLLPARRVLRNHSSSSRVSAVVHSHAACRTNENPLCENIRIDRSPTPFGLPVPP